MRPFVLLALLLIPVGAVQAQKHVWINPAKPCGDDSNGLPDGYYETVMSRIGAGLPGKGRPVITIAVGAEIKLILWTDGEKYQLWTDVPDVRQGTIIKFLDHLDDTCRLPPDPRDAASMIKINWEHADLTAAQFAELHRHFTDALSKYVAQIQNRYDELIKTKIGIVHLDSIGHPIVYNNFGYEHVETFVWEEDDAAPPLLQWVHDLQKLGESSFHRKFWVYAPPR